MEALLEVRAPDLEGVPLSRLGARALLHGGRQVRGQAQHQLNIRSLPGAEADFLRLHAPPPRAARARPQRRLGRRRRRVPHPYPHPSLPTPRPRPHPRRLRLHLQHPGARARAPGNPPAPPGPPGPPGPALCGSALRRGALRAFPPGSEIFRILGFSPFSPAAFDSAAPPVSLTGLGGGVLRIGQRGWGGGGGGDAGHPRMRVHGFGVTIWPPPP